MAAGDDEIDFSSYLVDLGELDDLDSHVRTGSTSSATPTPGEASGSSYAQTLGSVARNTTSDSQNSFMHLNTHAAKNWSGALLVRSVTNSVSPSPPEETSSDSSYKASTTAVSTPSTVGTSLASTSYTSSAGSYMTQKPASQPFRPTLDTVHAQAASSNQPLSPSVPGLGKGPNPRRQASIASSSSMVPVSDTQHSRNSSVAMAQPVPSSAGRGSALPCNGGNSFAGSVPGQLNLSFNYDFAHNPAPLDHTSTASAHPAQLSASMPSSDWLSRLGGRTNFQEAGNVNAIERTSDSHADDIFSAALAIPPSSGPQSAAHRPHRSRQSSMTSTAHSPGVATLLPNSGQQQPFWLSMTGLAPSSPASTSVLSSSHPGKPYARPEGPAAASQGLASGGTGSLQKRPSKRKAASTSTASLFANPSDRMASLNGALSTSPTTNSAPVSSYILPSQGYLHREALSNVASPISPVADSFASFSVPTSAAPSAAASPSHPGRSASSASTPGEAVLSAVTAPSPFDPRNFTDQAFNPLATHGEHGTAPMPGEASSGVMNPVDVDKAVALAGIGAKWFNWANQQSEDNHQPVLASVLSAQSPPVLTGGTAASSSQPVSSVASAAGGSKPTDALSPASGAGSGAGSTSSGGARSYYRESSLAPHSLGDWPDVDGQTPEEMAAKDPLATHLWRLYAKAKAGLPNGARMENITWRMMSLKLNKQKEQEKANQRAAASAATGPTADAGPNSDVGPHEQSVTSQARAAQATSETAASKLQREEDERGRRGRGAANSTSPTEAAEAADFMDWRQASRSRSRPGMMSMDWRAASRSRSRAPNMRISLPSSSSGFAFPSYTHGDGSIVPTQEFAYMGDQGAPAPPTSTNTAAVGTMSSGSRDHDGPGNMSIADTLKYFMAQSAPAMPSNAAGHSQASGPQQSSHIQETPTYAPIQQQQAVVDGTSHPAPLPMVGPTTWSQAPQVQQTAVTPFDTYTNIATPGTRATPAYQDEEPQNLFENLQSLSSSEIASSLQESKQSISASVEAYLSSLDYNTSVIDLPPHRHAGSVPGLFHEQDLKANQHAEFGFLPKLVRKTSFDASYPASLAQAQQRKAPAAEQSGSQSVVSTPFQSNLTSYFKSQAAQAIHSMPGTPTLSHIQTPYNPSSSNGPMFHDPNMNNEQSAALQNQFSSASQIAAIEAFRRLQVAQALQAANANVALAEAQQQQQSAHLQATMLDPALLTALGSDTSLFSSGIPNNLDPALFSAGLNVSPSQFLSMNAFSNATVDPTSALHSPWMIGSGQASPSSAPTPEDSTLHGNEPALLPSGSVPGSAKSSRSSSLANILPAPSELAGSAQQAASSKKSHSRTSSVVTPPATTQQATQADGSASATVCINCKTTNTPLWRRDENGQPLCNACQLFRKLHGSDRPVSLHNSVIKKRNRARNTNKEAPKKSGSRTHTRRNSTTAQQGLSTGTT